MVVNMACLNARRYLLDDEIIHTMAEIIWIPNKEIKLIDLLNGIVDGKYPYWILFEYQGDIYNFLAFQVKYIISAEMYNETIKIMDDEFARKERNGLIEY